MARGQPGLQDSRQVARRHRVNVGQGDRTTDGNGNVTDRLTGAQHVSRRFRFEMVWQHQQDEPLGNSTPGAAPRHPSLCRRTAFRQRHTKFGNWHGYGRADDAAACSPMLRYSLSTGRRARPNRTRIPPAIRRVDGRQT